MECEGSIATKHGLFLGNLFITDRHGFKVFKRKTEQLPQKVFEFQTEERLFPIGRLDKDTSGLLLLTNHGFLANYLMHPKNKIPRVYKLEIDKIFQKGEKKRLASKIYIGQKEWGRAEILSQKKDRGRIIVHLRLLQGKKREIRRMMYRMKRELFSLQRTKFGPIELGDIALGEWRDLNPSEFESLTSIISSNSV